MAFTTMVGSGGLQGFNGEEKKKKLNTDNPPLPLAKHLEELPLQLPPLRSTLQEPSPPPPHPHITPKLLTMLDTGNLPH